jgi:hypothetical protein
MKKKVGPIVVIQVKKPIFIPDFFFPFLLFIYFFNTMDISVLGSAQVIATTAASVADITSTVAPPLSTTTTADPSVCIIYSFLKIGY